MTTLLRNKVKLSASTQITGNDRRWLLSQGYDWPPPRHIMWYKIDGTLMMLPSDSYHLSLYRAKGFTLIPPMQTTPQAVHPLAESVSQALGDLREWTGEPSDLKQLLMSDMEVSALSKATTTREVTASLAGLVISVKRFRTRNGRGVHISRTA